MATALQSLRMTARFYSCRTINARYTSKPIAQRRLFSTTPRQYAIDPKFAELLEIEEDDDEFLEEIDELVEDAGARQLGKLPQYSLEDRRKKFKPTFLNMGEDEPFDEEDREDEDDDISTLAHMELERIRDIRHYNRLAAWEMPLLSKLAKPFVPPSHETPLRFRYTSYMGEQHPAEKKVVMEFCPADMPGLTKVETNKLRKLVGPRLNPETDIVKMSCEKYPSQAQNKRYLGDLVDSLLEEVKRGDTFEDVPLDTRHHVQKAKPRFPVAWRMTETRKEDLAKYRQMMAETDSNREYIGEMVDGLEMIEQSFKIKASPVSDTFKGGGKVIGNKKFDSRW